MRSLLYKVVECSICKIPKINGCMTEIMHFSHYFGKANMHLEVDDSWLILKKEMAKYSMWYKLHIYFSHHLLENHFLHKNTMWLNKSSNPRVSCNSFSQKLHPQFWWNFAYTSRTHSVVISDIFPHLKIFSSNCYTL